MPLRKGFKRLPAKLRDRVELSPQNFILKLTDKQIEDFYAGVDAIRRNPKPKPIRLDH